MPKSSLVTRRRVRKSFGRIPEASSMPNLIEVQRSSYEAFLQHGVATAERRDLGLQGVIRSVFPITDFAETASLEFVKLGTRQRSVVDRSLIWLLKITCG